MLVDCSPDLREQLLDAEVDWLDGVLITHEHADHTHGIDDLRAAVRRTSAGSVDVYLDEPTSRAMHARFGYCFATPPGSDYPPILQRASAGARASRDDRRAGRRRSRRCPCLQNHGDIPSLGFRFGNVAYSADIKGLPAESLARLRGSTSGSSTRCARRRIRAISISTRRWRGSRAIKPKRAILTNLHTDMDYAALRAQLPAGVEPAYDGMTVRSASRACTRDLRHDQC